MKSLTATEMANIEKCITGPGWDRERYTKGKQGDFIINVILTLSTLHKQWMLTTAAAELIF